ncbi:hypothetical protein KC19_3G124200 [Ceratodon purpureus]|uniref:Secreted protein n=1 Tax=Ceratodon purpureus TaxID=3225 RepID=A0A8T0ILG1_CERPU|nr:hypothetical protein KC19_3G124200 [Ceratodon purpureus]
MYVLISFSWSMVSMVSIATPQLPPFASISLPVLIPCTSRRFCTLAPHAYNLSPSFRS